MSARLEEAIAEILARLARLEKATKTPPRVSWRPREVAEMTGIRYEQVLELIKSGRLGAIKEGRLHVVPDEELRAYLKQGHTDRGAA